MGICLVELGMMKVYGSLLEAVDDIRAGKVGVLPTDTLYGLVCAAANDTAVHRLHSLKRREGKPGTLIAASVDQLVNLGLKRRYLVAVEQYWPGPISIEIPHDITHIHRGTGRSAVRIPNSEELLLLLQQTGPLQTSSANLTGEPCATTLKEAQDYFGDAVDFYVDGGDLSGREPSTVMRIIDDAVEVIREGAVKIDETGRIAR